MRASSLQRGFIIFILFFGVSLLEAVEGAHWLSVVFWLAIGTAFVVLDNRRKAGTCS